jgi:hypothetical protein
MVNNGQKATDTNFNNAFLSRTQNSDTVGVVGLNNTSDVNSGAQIVNAQRAVNKLFDSDGTAGEADGNAKNYANNNFIVDGDSRKVAIERLDLQLGLTNDEANSLRDLSGTAPGDDDLGTFTGSTISDDVTIKTALQELETEVELKIDLTEKGAALGVATLDAGGKIPATQLPNSVMEYKGVWNALTNTPTLADGIGNAGDVYRVSVAGTQNLGSGSVTYVVGDFVIYDGAIWQRSASTDAVSSVNGFTGTVVLDTDDISEGATNLYFTNSRADARIAAASIDDLSDVDTTTNPPSSGDVLAWDGAQWEPQAPGSGGGGTPHITTYSSGSGTFTPNVATLWMRVRMIGAGGGGAGGGVNGTTTGGGNGSATTFGSLSAGGGAAGAAGASNGGAGGTGSGTVSGYSLTGGQGGAHLYYSAGGLNIGGGGGSGGATVFGGAGMAGSAGGGPATGGAGASNTGAGGGGGGSGSSGGSIMRSGAGGGSGAYVEEYFTAPLAGSYSYAIGTGGTAGAAGTAGGPGGAGGSGFIIIEEYY